MSEEKDEVTKPKQRIYINEARKMEQPANPPPEQKKKEEKKNK